MKVILANIPWWKDGRIGVRAGSRWPHLKCELTEKEYLSFPFFLAYAAALLKKNGVDVKLIDAIALRMREERFFKELRLQKPELLVVETSTPSLKNDLKLLRKIGKDIKIVLCGPNVTIRNPDFLKDNVFIDYVLAGEYEYSLLDLVKHLENNEELINVLGLIYRKTDKIKINPLRPLIKDLDQLPWPLREDLPLKKYLDNPGEMPLPCAQMWASRGCPYKCTFCLWPQVMYYGNTYRARDPIKVVDEMEYLVKKMRFKSIYFDDDTFNIGKDRVLHLCSEIEKRKIKVPFAVMARPDLMDEEILKHMKKAGLYAIKYGVESSVQELLDRCGKNMDLKKSEYVIKLTKKLGIKTHLTFTFGLPGETRDTIRQTINYAIKLDPHSLQFSITTPFPGTKYYEQLDREGLIISKEWTDYDGNLKSVCETVELSAEDIKDALITAYHRWGEHLEIRARNRKIKGNYQRFKMYFKDKGMVFALKKAVSYLIFLIKDRNRKIKESFLEIPLDIQGVLNGRHAFVGPGMAEIDLTNQCNNSCIGCWIHSPLLKGNQTKNKFRTLLSTETFMDLIDELHDMGTEEIRLSGAGEPFMHPDIIKMLEYIKKKKMKVDIITNLTLIDKDIVKKLVDLEIDLITASIWAGTSSTYLKLHPNQTQQTFSQIRESLKAIRAFKEERGKNYPHVRIYNVICNLNFNEIEQMFEFALDTGADFLEFQVVDIIPGVTDFLLLSKEQKEQLERQIYNLKERYSTFCNFTRNNFLAQFQDKLLRTECEDTEIFYRLPRLGFRIDEKTEKILCLRDRESLGVKCLSEKTIVLSTPKIYSLKLEFDSTVCNRCDNRTVCYGQNHEKSLKVKFLTFLGVNFFLIRIYADNAYKGEYEKEGIDTIPCSAGWTYTRILSNGDVIPCCKANLFPMGNIYKSSFKKIWNSCRYNKFRYKAKYSKKTIKYFSKIDCCKSCDNLGMNFMMHDKIINLSLRKSFFEQGRFRGLDRYIKMVLKEDRDDVVVMAKNFSKGNLNTVHNFGKNLVVDGGEDFGFVQYELHFSKGGRYELWIRYASRESRPVKVYLDKKLIKKDAMNKTTGGWTKKYLLWFKIDTLNISKGRHLLEIYCEKFVPHIERFMFKKLNFIEYIFETTSYRNT